MYCWTSGAASIRTPPGAPRLRPMPARCWPGSVSRPVTVLGVLRSYQTRHGAGPLPSEFADPTGLLPERHNGAGPYQGGWRVGHLDPVLLRYAIEACGGVDGLALTHLDRRGSGQFVKEYRYRGHQVGRLPLGAAQDLRHQRRLTTVLARQRNSSRRSAAAGRADRRADRGAAGHLGGAHRGRPRPEEPDLFAGGCRYPVSGRRRPEMRRTICDFGRLRQRNRHVTGWIDTPVDGLGLTPLIVSHAAVPPGARAECAVSVRSRGW